MTDDWLRGYQLFVDGVLQGVNLTIPLRVVIEGVPHTASLGSTWRVMPRYRAYSLLLAKQVDLKVRNKLCFNGTPTPRVLKLLGENHKCIRDNVEASVLPANVVSVLRRQFNFAARTKPLPKLIQTQPKQSQSDISSLINSTWKKTNTLTGPVRDWAYWEWFAELNPTLKVSVAVVTPSKNHQPVFGLIADFGKGQLHLADLWPATASSKDTTALLKLVSSAASSASFHSVLVPHLTPNLAASAKSILGSRHKTLNASIWTNIFPLPRDLSNQYWPTYTGDALI